MSKCIVCQEEIPAGRLKALPGTKTCVNHSTALKFAVNIVSYGDAEAGELTQEVEVIRDERLSNKLQQYKKQLGSYK
jgi:hypothetical protein